MPGSLTSLLHNTQLQWLGVHIKQLAATLAALKTNAPMPARDVVIYTMVIVTVVVLLLKFATRERKAST
jgi:hypothetical protein